MINKFVFSYNESFSITLNPLFIQDSSNSVSGTIDWGDGSTSSYTYSTALHTYSNGGTYNVTYNTQGSTKIGNGFCANNSYLISCELSNELTNICAGTFYGTPNLKELNVPYMCIVENNSCSYSGLEIVNFGSPNKKSIVNYTSHGTNAFYMCSHLKNINYYYKLSILVDKVGDYFYNDTNSYHIIKFKTEIRNIRIGSHMPSFRNIDVERESKTIWKIALGSKIIWNIHPDTTTVEYLKVYESYVGKKFLESYETQSVYTIVCWVHEVNGVEIETYLSTSELQSWECETLEPYYYIDSDRQYVGYYQIPVGTGFGQHDMKITYKSPDTGNILSVEYPIYYLEEIDFINNLTEVFDWYPFRHPFGLGESTLPYDSFSLYYNCYDKKGNLIEEYATINATPENLSFEFPTISTGQFKFEENQKFGIVYVSETLKTYSTTMIVNVRPYYDERNTSKQFDNIETEVLVNQVEPFKIDIDLNTEEHLYYDDDGNTVSKALDIPEFQMPEYISSTSRYQGSNENLGNSSSFGYIYWGDGTFSRYCAGQKFISNVSVSNSSSSANPLAWQDVKWRNGYYVSNDSRLTNFENNMFENYHRYEDFGEYSIEITNGMYRGVGNLDSSSHNEALMVFGGTDDNYRLFSGKNQHNNDYNILVGDNMYAWHITSIDFGKSAMYWWYRYISSGTNQYTHTARISRGILAYPETVEEKILAYENCFQFLFGLKSVRFSNKSCALRGYTDLTHTAQKSAFNYCSNLTDIYIEKTKKGTGFEDVESISRLEFSNHISGMFELNCNNISTLHFTDGNISIQD